MTKPGGSLKQGALGDAIARNAGAVSTLARPAGGFAVQLGRAPLVERKDDLYETPACAVHALLRCEKLPSVIWEPACGRGAISRILLAAGHDVRSTDLVDYGFGESGIDFLMETRAPKDCECVVTNPPFKLADQFVRHALRLAPRVIVLLRWAYAEGAGRADLIDEHLTRVWLGKERLPFMHRDGYEGRRNANSGAPFAWFVFEQQRRIPTGFLVQRMSWREPA